MNTFQKGDVVQLKSGGPKMTVVDTSDGRVDCCWFKGDQSTPEHYCFDAVTLEKVEPSKSRAISR